MVYMISNIVGLPRRPKAIIMSRLATGGTLEYRDSLVDEITFEKMSSLEIKSRNILIVNDIDTGSTT